MQGRIDSSFTPSAETARAFRTALGRFATGVTVVTTRTADGPMGITANSFASLSLDPPLVLWSPARASKRFDAFTDCTHFAIHVLAREQIGLGQHFARQGEDFAISGIEQGLGDVPLLPGCLARFECTRAALHDGGDHVIVVGRVERAMWRDGEPLIFSAGTYGRFHHGA